MAVRVLARFVFAAGAVAAVVVPVIVVILPSPPGFAFARVVVVVAPTLAFPCSFAPAWRKWSGHGGEKERAARSTARRGVVSPSM